MSRMTKINKNKKNRNFEIPPEILATEGNPKAPAMNAMIKKMKASFNIFYS